MYKCIKCQANVDAGEIHGGICDDCTKQDNKKEERRIEMDWIARVQLKREPEPILASIKK